MIEGRNFRLKRIPAALRGSGGGDIDPVQAALNRFSFHAPLTKSVILSRGVGAASYTRATVATVKDFEGNIRNCVSGEVRFEGQRRVRNWLAVPEDFSSATWTTIAGGTGTVPTKTANYASAPDGTTTACRVQATVSAGTAGGDYSLMRQAATYNGTGAVGSVWMKSNTGASQGVIVSYDEAVVVTVTTSWQRFSWPRTVGSNHFDIGCRGDSAANKTVDVLVWHPQMEALVGASNQNPSEYVSVGADKSNLFTYTEELDNAAWTKTRSSITANTVANPLNGAVNAEKLVEDGTAANLHFLRQSIAVVSGNTYTISAYVKAAGREYLGLQGSGLTGSGTAYFDLALGVVGNTFNGATNAIESLGDGWYRVSMTVTAVGTGSDTMTLYLCSAAGNASYNGDGASGIYVYGMQAERASTPGTYFPVGSVYPYHGSCVDGVKYFDTLNGNTVASNVVTEGTTRTPCLGYTSGSWTNSAVGYLPEGATTNLVLQSSNFGTTWDSVGGGTPTRSAAAAYVGDVALDLLGDDDAAAAEYFRQLITFTADASKSVSFVVKQGSATNSLFKLSDDTAATARMTCEIAWSNGAPVATFSVGSQERPPEALANGAYRIFGLAAGVIAANANRIYVYPANTAAGSAAATGTIYVGGVQAENATVASSHIPTTTATVTRNLDNLSYPGAGNINATEGTIYAEVYFDKQVGATQVVCEVDDGTTSERYVIYRDSLSDMRFIATDGGVQQAGFIAGAAANGMLHKVAVRYKANDFAGSLNGAAVVTDTSGTLPTVTTIFPGIQTGTTTPANSPMKNLRIATVTLSNQELTLITR